jgi:hypothetical protein
MALARVRHQPLTNTLIRETIWRRTFAGVREHVWDTDDQTI